jgi:hypothetical protein
MFWLSIKLSWWQLFNPEKFHAKQGSFALVRRFVDRAIA